MNEKYEIKGDESNKMSRIRERDKETMGDMMRMKKEGKKIGDKVI